MLKKLPLWVKIIIGMAAGFIWGMFAVETNLGDFTINWIKPWGTIFLKLLKLIAVPLIFVSLIKGISSLSNITKLSRIGLKTVSYYIVSTLIATFLGLLIVNVAKPGDAFPEEKRDEYMGKWEFSFSDKLQAAEEAGKSPLAFFEEMVPDNVFMALGDNSKMLQVIFFAILFAIAMVMVPQEKVKTIRALLDSLDHIILRIVAIIMEFTPIGVFGLLAGVVVDFAGDTDIFVALGKYFFTVVFGLLFLVLVLYPLYLKLFTRNIGILKFYKALLPAQIVAFSTSSSAAALPVTMRQNTEVLGVSEEISNFVLPVGVTINMDATAFYQAIAAVFIAQVYGIDLTIFQQLTIVMTATLSSIGAPGVPGGSIVLIIMVLTSVGLPLEGLALILGVDRPLDMLRSAVNLTGDSTINNIVAYSENEILPDPLPPNS